MKSGAIIASDFFDGLNRLSALVDNKMPGVDVESRLVYRGSEGQKRTDVQVVHWNRMLDLDLGLTGQVVSTLEAVLVPAPYRSSGR